MHQSRATHHLLRSPFVFSGVRQLQREQFFVQDLLKTFKMCQNMAVMSADCQMPVIHFVGCRSMGLDAIALRLANSLWRRSADPGFEERAALAISFLQPTLVA
jgi:hypothetical protein